MVQQSVRPFVLCKAEILSQAKSGCGNKIQFAKCGVLRALLGGRLGESFTIGGAEVGQARIGKVILKEKACAKRQRQRQKRTRGARSHAAVLRCSVMHGWGGMGLTGRAPGPAPEQPQLCVGAQPREQRGTERDFQQERGAQQGSRLRKIALACGTA